MDDISKKINEYRDNKIKEIDWPHEGLINGIIDDILEIVEESSK
ncbi:hypothetical protein ACWN8V_06985 [Vagococcus elongatus]|nr:hypothetical protein [Vagococcus elongatus]